MNESRPMALVLEMEVASLHAKVGQFPRKKLKLNIMLINVRKNPRS